MMLLSRDVAWYGKQKEAPVCSGAFFLCALLPWRDLARSRRCNRTTDRAAAFADLHGLHAGLGFRPCGIGRSRTHDSHGLRGGSLFDDGAAFRRGVLDDVVLCRERGRDKCGQSCRGNQQSHPHEVLLCCGKKETKFLPDWFHCVADARRSSASGALRKAPQDTTFRLRKCCGDAAMIAV